MVYLALYKAKGNWLDKLIRFVTRSKYSHCEIAIKYTPDGKIFECYSSSPRDGGVRCKRMSLNNNHWDLVPLTCTTQMQIKEFYNRTKGKKYDFLGAIGTVLPCLHLKNCYFCSEWAAECLGLDKAEYYSPATLSNMVKKIT